MNALERIQKILSEHLSVEIEKVMLDSHFYDDLGADSLDLPEIMMAFEEEFGIAIPDRVAEMIATPREALIQLELKYEIT